MFLGRNFEQNIGKDFTEGKRPYLICPGNKWTRPIILWPLNGVWSYVK